jgi:hypothetical protein
MCCAMASYDIQAIALPGQRAGSAFALKKVMQHILTFADLTLHYLERLYDYWKEAPGLVAANPKLLAELNWAHFWAIQILLKVDRQLLYPRRSGPRDRPRQAPENVSICCLPGQHGRSMPGSARTPVLRRRCAAGLYSTLS